MSKPGANLQDSFLNQVRKEDQEVAIVMTNGMTLNGHVKGFDNFTVILGTSDGKQHLIYKHAIAQVIGSATVTPRSADSRRGRSDKEGAKRRTSETNQPDASESKNKEPFNKIDLSGLKLDQ
jgi:host factor-I protein